MSLTALVCRSDLERGASSRGPSAGFSLIEVLIGLAITSVISVLIFASLATQMTQADAVRRSTRAALDATLSARLVDAVISSTVPAWHDEDVAGFRGTRDVVSGHFVNRLFGASTGLEPYTVTLRREGEESLLEVVAGDETWRLTGLPLTAEFRYLGQSGIWRDSWPPLPATHSSAPDFQAFLYDYGLPAMVRVWDPATERPAGFEASFENSGVLPARTQDLVINE